MNLPFLSDPEHPIGKRRGAILTALEVALLIGWTWFFARPLLNFSPDVIPQGREFTWAINYNYAWDMIKECGACAYWNGSLIGGYPAFANPQASFLHPLTAITTLLWGVRNGAKAALFGGFLMAALAQWALGRSLGLGRLPRTWAGMMAVTAGNLAIQLEQGTFGVFVSLATFSVVMWLFVELYRKKTVRLAVLLGVALAALALGGQGYIQMGSVVPLGLALVVIGVSRGSGEFWPFLRLFALAVGLALLLAAPLLVPFLHFLPNFGKDFDLEFRWAQPLAYVPVNLVINDFDFYKSSTLGKLPYPAQYANYLGWIPVLLTPFAFWRNAEGQRRAVWVLAAIAFGALWAASAQPFAWAVALSPWERLDRLFAGIRSVSFIAGLAAPPLLALAGIGLDRLLQLDWPALRLELAEARENAKPVRAIVSARWLLVAAALLALKSTYEFSAAWVKPIATADTAPVLEAIRTPDAQWVSFPLGQIFWLEAAVSEGYKVAVDYVSTWHWHEREQPPAYLAVLSEQEAADMEAIARVGDFTVFRPVVQLPYAYVEQADGERMACVAASRGGDIDVVCNSAGGKLVVQENSWTGWRANVNGSAARIDLNSRWLSVQVPAGQSQIAFRYRPWDAPVGIGLAGAGILLSGWLWVRQGRGKGDKGEGMAN